MSDPVVELDGVWVALGGAWVLEDIHLRVPQGEYMAIIGPNGSGKSTLLKVVLGLIRPDRGNVRVLGGGPRAARGRIGYVPQYATYDPGFPIRVIDVVKMGRLARRRLRRLRRADRERAFAALERVQMAHLAHRPVEALSGGQRQRVLIARALAAEPEVLVLDEPTASLDVQSAEAFYELLEGFARKMTVLLVSHDVGAVSQQVRSIACLNRHLVSHPSAELTPEMVEAAYGCPVELLGHGIPHRVLQDHDAQQEADEPGGAS